MNRGENRGLPLVRPMVVPPLDEGFRPAVLANRGFRAGLGKPVRLEAALERSEKAVSRFETVIASPDDRLAKANFTYLERWLKFLLWSRGGVRIYLSGSAELAGHLQRHYRESATGKFDANIMGEKVYERPFEVLNVQADRLPRVTDLQTKSLGGHWNGCRIGFDLGASDRKVAAVKDGKVMFTEEVPWNPRAHSDPRWHFDQIMDSLRRATAHLPRVDAIGGSAAGIYVDNQVRLASLFRGVSEEAFRRDIRGIFFELKKAWGGIPFEVVNDGEVTALAGAMSLNDMAVLGVSLGSSQAAGYVTPQGTITAWLNELAFAPVDYNPNAAVDEWSGDYGCGVQYFSQQAVGRLIPRAGLNIDATLALPEQLLAVQEHMARGNERAKRIYETIGIYLGYTIAHYADFYEFKHLLLLGRVTTGNGGAIIVEKAKEVLKTEFPELAHIQIHLPDEKEKRHGQAMAAASLPIVN